MTPVDWPTVDLLTHRARATPDRIGIVEGGSGETWTWRAFSDRVDVVADQLDSFVSSGDRLGLLVDAPAAFATLFFAAMRRGVAVAPFDPRQTRDELAPLVERAGTSLLVCSAGTERAAVDVAGAPVASVDAPSTTGVHEITLGSRDANEGDDAGLHPAPLDRYTTQLVAFTSGTTASPKAVRLTVGNLVASATASAFRLGVDPADRWLSCLPMHHVGGLAPVIRSTLSGTTVVLGRGFDVEGTARAMDEHRVTGVSLVPTMLQRLLDAGWTPPDSLRFVLLGGAPASRELLDRALGAGVPIHPTYGTTETASQIATAHPDELSARPGTVGAPLLFAELTVVGDDGTPVEPGNLGELVVSGPMVTPGYDDPATTDEAFGEYGLRTGDVGYRDEDGYVWVCGRRDDRIVTGGENVDPDEVVGVLSAFESVAEAAVVGLEDEEWGERVAALLVPAGDDVAVEAVLADCDDRLAGYKRPKTVAVVDSLPRTASGTIDREAVREHLRAHGVDVTGGRARDDA